MIGIERGCLETASKTKKQNNPHKRLQRRKYKMLRKARNKTLDLCHKATRKIADAFPNAKAYVGEPFNAACQKISKIWAQQVSSACNRVIINQLNYKLAACIEVNEAYTSKTCPSCGKRSKHSRIYKCRCGLKAPRDLVGCLNIRAIGIDGAMTSGRVLPKTVIWKHPAKYPGISPGSPTDARHVARQASAPRIPCL
jgi:transposase